MKRVFVSTRNQGRPQAGTGSSRQAPASARLITTRLGSRLDWDGRSRSPNPEAPRKPGSVALAVTFGGPRFQRKTARVGPFSITVTDASAVTLIMVVVKLVADGASTATNRSGTVLSMTQPDPGNPTLHGLRPARLTGEALSAAAVLIGGEAALVGASLSRHAKRPMATTITRQDRIGIPSPLERWAREGA